MNLDLSSLQGALAALEDALSVRKNLPNTAAPTLDATVRGGVIQAFEVCYEQCWKFIQRWLTTNAAPDLASRLRTRRDLFRHAAQAGLVADAEAWFQFGMARNQTSHTYRLATAEEVATAAAGFVPVARQLLATLQRSNG